MKPGVLLLVIGGIVLAAGVVVASISVFSVTKQVLEGSTIIDSTTLEPNLALHAEIIGLPAGQQLLLSLSSTPTDVPLEARISGPDGSTLALYNITGTPFTSAAATSMSGNHTLEIRNVGTRTVTIAGALLNSPISAQGGGVGVNDDPSVQTLVTYGIGILVGIVLIVAGIVLLIIGAIKYARGRRQTPSTGTAQG